MRACVRVCVRACVLRGGDCGVIGWNNERTAGRTERGEGGGGAVWVTMELKTSVISLSVTSYDSGWRGRGGGEREREREGERERERESHENKCDFSNQLWQWLEEGCRTSMLGVCLSPLSPLTALILFGR